MPKKATPEEKQALQATQVEMQALISKGFEDAISGRAFPKDKRSNRSYEQGYRTGLKQQIRWAEEKLINFDAQVKRSGR